MKIVLQIDGSGNGVVVTGHIRQLTLVDEEIVLQITAGDVRALVAGLTPHDFTLDNLNESNVTTAHFGGGGHEGVGTLIQLLHALRYDIDQQLVIAYNLSSFLDEFNFHGWKKWSVPTACGVVHYTMQCTEWQAYNRVSSKKDRQMLSFLLAKWGSRRVECA